MKRRRNQQLSPVGSPPSDNESGNAYDCSREQDRFLPVANVSRIMKKALPTNAKISKEAKGMVQECVSEFINFITGEASEKCQREKRKTINGDDLLWAMTTLGFENYVGPLKAYLSKYRETEGEKNSMARQGDSSPTEDNNNNLSLNHSAASTASFSGFNSGLYSMGPSVASQGFGGGGGGGRIMGYADQSKIGAFEIGRINGDGEANGGRALPSYLHGVHWQ